MAGFHQAEGLPEQSSVVREHPHLLSLQPRFGNVTFSSDS